MSQLEMFGKGNAGTAPKQVSKHGLTRATKPTIQDRFEAFHKANPHVLDELLKLVRARLERGERRIGVKALWEDLRRRLDLLADGGFQPDGQYKLNNDFTALYARRLIEILPQLDGVIELRRRKAK